MQILTKNQILVKNHIAISCRIRLSFNTYTSRMRHRWQHSRIYSHTLFPVFCHSILKTIVCHIYYNYLYICNILDKSISVLELLAERLPNLQRLELSGDFPSIEVCYIVCFIIISGLAFRCCVEYDCSSINLVKFASSLHKLLLRRRQFRQF